MCAHRSCELVAQRRFRRVRVHVDGLLPRVRGRVWRSGVVRAEDVHQALAVQVLGEPHETRTEHRVGGCQEIQLQRLNGRAGFGDGGSEGCRDPGGGRGLFKYTQSEHATISIVSRVLTRQLKKKWLL